MALIPHTFFPRSLFGGTTMRDLDLFDPFDDLDMQMNQQLNNMFHMLDRPLMAPPIMQKYRVTVDCAGYNPKSLKTEITGDKLVVTGKEGDPAKSPDEDHTHRSFRRTFNLPKLVEKSQMTSFVDNKRGGCTLVIDIPYKMDESGVLDTQMMPKVIDTNDGHKAINMDLKLPVSIDPSKVQVTAKDRDIIIRAEEKNETPNGYSTASFYRRSTMPENADIKHMSCVCHDGNQLSVTAPLVDHALPGAKKAIQIEPKVE